MFKNDFFLKVQKTIQKFYLNQEHIFSLLFKYTVSKVGCLQGSTNLKLNTDHLSHFAQTPSLKQQPELSLFLAVFNFNFL